MLGDWLCRDAVCARSLQQALPAFAAPRLDRGQKGLARTDALGEAVAGRREGRFLLGVDRIQAQGLRVSLVGRGEREGAPRLVDIGARPHPGRHQCSARLRQPGLRPSVASVLGHSRRQRSRPTCEGQGWACRSSRREGRPSEVDRAAGNRNTRIERFRQGDCWSLQRRSINDQRHPAPQDLGASASVVVLPQVPQ